MYLMYHYNMSIIFQVILAVIGISAVLVALASINHKVWTKIRYGQWTKEQKTRDGLNTKNIITYSMIALWFIGWGIIYFNSFYGVFWFLPNDAGVIDEYGDWVSHRRTLTLTFATLALWFHCENYRNYQDKIK